ncbi:MAG: hypothetical protein ONB05_12260 [candidate division KSB1 bacterium]|nr:hypothetical protein [candidate division KSB1 bacterium]
MNFEVEERVDRLEALRGQFIVQTNSSLIRLERGMEKFKDGIALEIRQMNKKWGELSNKMGTLVEDLVFPSMSRIIQERFDMEIEDLMIRRKRKLKDGRVKEFDLIGIAGEFVFLNSTKSTLRNPDIKDFIDEIEEFWEFFPEYRDKKLIGILVKSHQRRV